MFSAGALLADRYRLQRRIAVGGMGEVWEASDSRLDRRVAIKILKAELSSDPEFLHRFRTEARTTAGLNHPGIAAVHDYGETVIDSTDTNGESADSDRSATDAGDDEPSDSTDSSVMSGSGGRAESTENTRTPAVAKVDGAPHSTAYLVMELVEGEPLAAVLARHRRLSAAWTLDVLEQAGNALQAAHAQGLVHRDVKPGNILVVYGGDTHDPNRAQVTVKLTDFGIAKAAHAASVTRSGTVMGTAHYIAPEQALGQEATPAADVYSLAVCGYECLAGHRPFLSDNSVTVAMKHIHELPPPLPPDVHPAVRALIEATLVKDPRQRYLSGGEFASAVAAVKAGRPLPMPSGMVAVVPLPVPAPGFVGTVGPAGHVADPVAGPVLSPPVVPQPMAAGFTPGPSQSAPISPVPAVGRPHAPHTRRWPWVLLLIVVLIAIGVGIWALTTMPGSNGGGVSHAQSTGHDAWNTMMGTTVTSSTAAASTTSTISGSGA